MAAVLTAVALWPALWADPWATLEFVRAGSTKYAGRAVDTAHFFLGATVVEPGPRFYPVAFAFRLAPLMLLGLGASLAAWRRMRPVERRVWLVAVGLAVGYAAALSLSPKKFDRYLLPTWPAWALAAAIGYHAAWRGRMSGSSDPARGAVPPAAWRDRLPASPAARLAAIAVALVAVFQARAVLDPYAVAWYSPLGGGTAGAAAAIPVGWGEGLDRMAAAIDTDGADLGAPPGQRTMVATSAVPGLAPLVRAAVIPLDPERLADADAVVRYLADTQVPAPDWLAPVLAHTPVVTTTVHGIPFAWAYRNTAAGDIADAVRGEPAPIFTGRADYIARHLAGARVLGEEEAANRRQAVTGRWAKTQRSAAARPAPPQFRPRWPRPASDPETISGWSPTPSPPARTKRAPPSGWTPRRIGCAGSRPPTPWPPAIASPPTWRRVSRSAGPMRRRRACASGITSGLHGHGGRQRRRAGPVGPRSS